MSLLKEHFKAQMHRIAVALKREREKNNILARQEIEQLRLDFLTREERFVLLHVVAHCIGFSCYINSFMNLFNVMLYVDTF